MARPNVVLVIADSLRAQNTSLYGHDRDTTPNLSRFAQTATTYTHAYSPGRRSLPSHASIFTGTEIPQHRVITHGDSLAPGTTVFDDLSDEGYATGLFTFNSFFFDESYGLTDGFDTRVTRRPVPFESGADPRDCADDALSTVLPFCLRSGAPLRTLANGVFAKFASAGSSDLLIDSFTDWLDDVDGPWAAVFNLMDTHAPYLPEDRYNRWADAETRDRHAGIDDHVLDYRRGREPWELLRSFESLYDGAIRQFDANFDRIVSELDDRDVRDETLVVATADHGEGFGEHSLVYPEYRLVGHCHGIGEALFRVPLVVERPGQTELERRETPASLVRFPDVVRSHVDAATRRTFDEGPTRIASAKSSGRSWSTTRRSTGYRAASRRLSRDRTGSTRRSDRRRACPTTGGPTRRSRRPTTAGSRNTSAGTTRK